MKLIPKTRDYKLSHSAIIKSLIINYLYHIDDILIQTIAKFSRLSEIYLFTTSLLNFTSKKNLLHYTGIKVTLMHKSLAPKSFDDWALIFNKLFGDGLMKLHPGEVFLLLSEAGGTIAENVRRDRYYEVFSDLGLCLNSLINMYNRIANDPKYRELFSREEFPGLDRFIFERFPRRCPYCGGDHCICAIKYSDSENRTPEEKKVMKEEVTKNLRMAMDTESPPERLDDFKNLFKGIYGQGHQYMTIDIISFHLLEEIGELAKALRNLINGPPILRRQLRDEFLSEIADIISWIFALWRKIEYHIKNACKDSIRIPHISDMLEKDINLMITKG